MIDRKWTDKVRDTFDCHHLQVNIKERRIEEFRSQLPKAIRTWPVVAGELAHNGAFHPRS